MSAENESREVNSLHFDTKTRRLMTVLEDKTVLQFTLTHDLRLVYNGHFRAPATPEATVREAVLHEVGSPAQATDQPAAADSGPRTTEKQPIQTLTGRITQDVQPGRVDGRGNPTAWTIAAMHQDGVETAKMVAISFHRHTTRIALDRLQQGDQITVQGYLREARPPRPGERPRLDNFSAFQLINYPSKPASHPSAASFQQHHNA